MEPSDNDEPPVVPQYPTYVRWLAVLHVLSYVLGPLGYFILIVTAIVLYVQRRQIDQMIITWVLMAVACPVVAWIYRRWFENWGRKHWPGPDAAEQTANEVDRS